MANIIIRNAHIKDDKPLIDIRISGSIITEMKQSITNDNNSLEINADGNVVLPTFIESHLHPDKAFLEERKPNISGTLDEALKNTAELKSKYTYKDVYDRSERVIKWAIRNGTTIMRAIPDVDPFEKTLGVEVLIDLKEKYKELMDIQICAFPQEGIVRHPEVYEMLENSIQMGADIVGGCPYSEDSLKDTKKHINHVFDLAEKYDLSIDIHADFSIDVSDPQNNMVEFIAEKTMQRGYQGRVSLAHVTTLGSLESELAEPIFEKIAEAGISIIPLPATDLFINGQEIEKDKPRGMAPVKRMLKKGINVAYSSNNIRNAFTPFGDANLVTLGYLLQITQQMGSPEERAQIVQMATYHPAKALELTETYGLELGKSADLNIFDNHTIRDFINDQPKLRYVIKKGEVLVQNEFHTKLNPLLED